MHKLTLVEAERVMAVLQDTEDRLRLAALVPEKPAYDVADRLAEAGHTEAAHALRWLWKAEHGGSKDRRQNLRNVLRAMTADPAVKETLAAVSSGGGGGGDAGGAPDNYDFGGSGTTTPEMEEFLAVLDEHKKITVRRLSTTAEDAQLRRSFTEEVAQREKKQKNDFKELSEELSSLKKRREDEVTVLDKTIRKLQGELNAIQSLIRKEETSLAEEKRQKSEEADTSFKENSTKLKQDMDGLAVDLKVGGWR
jgi:chromosome segregation ATPase